MYSSRSGAATLGTMRGMLAVKTVPLTDELRNAIRPPRYRSVNRRMLYVPRPLFSPFVEKERWKSMCWTSRGMKEGLWTEK